MTTATDVLPSRLIDNAVHRRFVDHSFFRRIEAEKMTTEDVTTFLGQWWHPLHYFPTFLARCVSALPDIESKSAIAHILNQETGEGKPFRAHEVVYADSMDRAGFDRTAVTASVALTETVSLVEGYERASSAPCSAVGFIFATEVTDLQMVSGIGRAVERVTGVSDLEWVRIHVEQEPDHVDDAGRTLLRGFSGDEIDRVVRYAESMWQLWTTFFDRLEYEMDAGTCAGMQQVAP